MFSEPLPFIITYVCALAHELQRQSPTHRLSHTQQSGVSLCWASFERMGPGTYSVGALSWMLSCSKMAWSELLQASVGLVFA